MVLRVGKAREPQTNYLTSTHCVAYLDILGTKDRICKENDNKFLNYINMLCEDAINEAKHCKNIFTKIFSDNVLYAIKINDDVNKKEKITSIINIVANFQNETLRYGYLTRGAIAISDFFHNDTIVYGKALIKVVNMEENIAIYPRVIVEKEIQELLPQYFFESADGMQTLNNFFFSRPFEEISYKIQLLKMLKENKDNKKARQKIIWMINYFNECFAESNLRFLDKTEITEQEIIEAS